MSRASISLLGIFLAVLVVSGLLVYVFRDRSGRTAPVDRPATSAPGPFGAETPQSPGATQVAPADRSLITDLFGDDNTGLAHDYSSLQAISARITLRFALAAFLAAMLALRPRRGLSTSQRNPYVAQTQILMAVVAAAMMMVVGDSAARAFGIFAAASLVRFRTNIRDPKEITVLLICLGVGLAAGVGRWDMAIILAIFVLLILYILEHFEQSQVFRSMEVCVATRNADQTDKALRKIFARHEFDIELRQLDREDEEEPLGKVVYLVNVNPGISMNKLSEEIFSADRENIDSVEWDQKKSNTYIYR